MPKVFLNETDKLNSRLVSWVYGQMKIKGIRQSQLAEQMDLSQQMLSYKLKCGSITFKDFIGFVNALDPDINEIEWLVGKTKKGG